MEAHDKFYFPRWTVSRLGHELAARPVARVQLPCVRGCIPREQIGDLLMAGSLVKTIEKAKRGCQITTVTIPGLTLELTVIPEAF